MTRATSTGTTVTTEYRRGDIVVICDNPAAPDSMRHCEVGRIIEGGFQPASLSAFTLSVEVLRIVADLMVDQEHEDWKEALTFLGDEGHVFPFTEDEACNITGFGHQDKATFAEEVNRYDRELADGLEGPWTADDITHKWIVVDDAAERFRPVPEGTPDAFPVTTLWGAR